jgi:hypothetical protein
MGKKGREKNNKINKQYEEGSGHDLHIPLLAGKD